MKIFIAKVGQEREHVMQGWQNTDFCDEGFFREKDSRIQRTAQIKITPILKNEGI